MKVDAKILLSEILEKEDEVQARFREVSTLCSTIGPVVRNKHWVPVLRAVSQRSSDDKSIRK